MRCMSCGADIPPQWVKAIETNSCPGCGGEIMGSATQDLLKELTNAMTQMPNDPQGIAGWLLSNYRFQKIGSAEPVEKFHRKGGGGGKSSEGFDESNLKVDPTYNQFIKRNEAENLVARGEQLAKLKHGGNSQLAEFASMIQDVGDPYGDDTTVNTSNDAPPDIEDQRTMMELASAGINPFAGAVGGITDMSQAINPRDVQNLLTKEQNGPLKEEIELQQTPAGRAFLQRDQFKRLKAQDAISGGGGSFRR